MTVTAVLNARTGVHYSICQPSIQAVFEPDRLRIAALRPMNQPDFDGSR